MVGGSHGDHLRKIGWVIIARIVAIVPRRCNNHRTQIVRIAHRISDGLGSALASPGVADHIGAVICCVNERVRERRINAVTVIVQTFHGHDLRFPRNANYAYAVVPNGSDCSRDVRSVTEVIDRVVALRGVLIAGADKIPPTHVVYVSVAVIIDTVVRDLSCVDPNVACDVGMVVVNPCVDDRHDDARSGCGVPGRGRPDLFDPPKVVVRLAPAPITQEIRIIRSKIQ